MTLGSHSRPGHRALLAGGVALLSRPILPTGQHRRAQREPQRPMQLAMSGLAALIMTAICGLSLFFIVADVVRGHNADVAPTVAERDISSRSVDARPLTRDEVFGRPEIEPVSGGAPYEVLMTHVDTHCDVATVGTLGALLDENGCSQVVRAALAAPYGGYRVTAGIFNLADEERADRVSDAINARMEAGDGGFAVLSTGRPSVDSARPPLAQAVWHRNGHFLTYCVITRPDGALVRDDDPDANRITTELVQSYLGGTVLAGRSNP